MIRYENAVEIIEKVAARHASGLRTIEVPLAQATGMIAGESVMSPESVPSFDNSAMDGFAVRSAECITATTAAPVSFRIVGSIAAGDAPPAATTDTGVAWEIMTGAPMPPGFDAVVKVEDIVPVRDPRGEVLKVRISAAVRAGEYVRLTGEDFCRGEPVVMKGARVEPRHVLAAASLGIAKFRMRPKPRVAIIATGRELVPHDTKTLEPGHIRNSTLPYLEAALVNLGCEVVSASTVADSAPEFLQALGEANSAAPDLIITTGAVSMGRHDFVAPVLAEIGARVSFHKVAVRPGKPILFAEFAGEGKRPVLFGLPGNPVSTAVGLRFFVERYLRVLTGRSAEVPIRARLRNEVRLPSELRCFYKAKMEWGEGGASVEILPGQASFMVSPLLKANAWAIFPEGLEVLPAGYWVDVVPLVSG